MLFRQISSRWKFSDRISLCGVTTEHQKSAGGTALVESFRCVNSTSSISKRRVPPVWKARRALILAENGKNERKMEIKNKNLQSLAFRQSNVHNFDTLTTALTVAMRLCDLRLLTY